MSMTDVQPQNRGGIIATGLTASTLGGAIATVFTYYYHAAHPAEAIPPEAVEQGLQTIFTTVVMLFAMIGHVLLSKWLNSKT
jgi:uncharacterized membrane protein required for colicin V production